MAEDRLELALDLVNTAARVCQKAQGAAFRKELSERRKEVQTFKKEWEQIAPTLETVKANPEDADANLAPDGGTVSARATGPRGCRI